jgi:hypothetical protein
MFCEKFGEQAVVRGIEMLDQDEGSIGQDWTVGAIGGFGSGDGVE